MKKQIFKKGDVIVNSDLKNKYRSAKCVLLSKNFVLGEDYFMPYVNYFDVYYKPRTKNVVKRIYEEYDENGGGTITYDVEEGWHIANSWLTKMVMEKIKQIDENKTNKN